MRGFFWLKGGLIKKKGFTLLELIIVIIILGVLATLGMQQYFRVVEKSRSAEAKQVLGQLRENAAAYYTENNTMFGFDESMAGIGPASDQIPDLNFPCRSSHYFRYFPNVVGVDWVSFMAYRCVAGGKAPDYSIPATVQLVANFGAAASDAWIYDPPYR